MSDKALDEDAVWCLCDDSHDVDVYRSAGPPMVVSVESHLICTLRVRVLKSALCFPHLVFSLRGVTQ